MAMTKKEQADLLRVETMLALRWVGITPVLPDVPPPQGSDTQYTTGWAVNVYNKAVSQAWSGAAVHGEGSPPVIGHGRVRIQGALPLYATKQRALAALRFAVAWQAAEALRAIDQAIEEEGND